MFEVVVVGSGPAGLGVATAAAERGLSVALVAPDPERRWPNNYGVWLDELEPLGLQAHLEARWDEAVVELGPEGRHVLPRPYGRLDNRALQGALWSRAEAAGAHRVQGHVATVEHHAHGSELCLDDGRRCSARVVVDASGHAPTLAAREPGARPGMQVAYGILAEVARHPFAPGQMVLMDFRDDALPEDERPAREPSFLYAMPLPDGRLFLEETSLVSRPPMELAVLERRLHARLRVLGVEVREVHETERCLIPMGGPWPRAGERVVAFGAAASLVHPATGYMVGLALTDAPRLARALAGILERGRADEAALEPALRDLDGRELAWPRGRRRAHSLYRFGMEVLLQLDGADLRRFFRAFFELPPAMWRGYLSGSLDARGVASAMSRVFARLPAHLKGRLIRESVGPARASLLGAVWGG